MTKYGFFRFTKYERPACRRVTSYKSRVTEVRPPPGGFFVRFTLHEIRVVGGTDGGEVNRGEEQGARAAQIDYIFSIQDGSA